MRTAAAFVVFAGAFTSAPPRIVNNNRPSPAEYALPTEIEVDGGSRSADEIRAGLETAPLDDCTAGLVASDPGLPIAIVIDTAGGVQRAAVEGAAANDARAACVVRALSRALFSPSRDPFQVARFRLVPEAVPEGGIAVIGPLPKEKILAVIEEHGADVKSCDTTASEERIAGVVAVRFVVDARGNAVDVGIDHVDPNLKPISRCIVDAVSKMKFPAAGARTVVMYPFEL